MFDAFVPIGHTREGILRAMIDELIEKSLVENGSFADCPCASHAPLAFEGKPGQNQLAHLVLRALINGDCVVHAFCLIVVLRRDRKSTRLNSSHMSISYAVFCLKKKKMI